MEGGKYTAHNGLEKSLVTNASLDDSPVIAAVKLLEMYSYLEDNACYCKPTTTEKTREIRMFSLNKIL